MSFRKNRKKRKIVTERYNLIIFLDTSYHLYDILYEPQIHDVLSINII